MAETRKAIHAFLTPASHEAWHEFAAENGVSVSAMIEAMAIDWGDRKNGDTFELPELEGLARDARRIDAGRRRRRQVRS
jgi:hypothetical protein